MIKCLNSQCGSFRVSDERYIVNPKTAKPYPGHPFWRGVGYSMLCWRAAACTSFWSDNQSAQPTASIVGLLFAIGILYFFIRGIVLVIRKASVGVPVHLYECSTCGYKWLWIEGTPLPSQPAQYHPDPKLFAEQEKRDRMAAMYAAYMQQQRRP